MSLSFGVERACNSIIKFFTEPRGFFGNGGLPLIQVENMHDMLKYACVVYS
jgi:hypothetical protein